MHNHDRSNNNQGLHLYCPLVPSFLYTSVIGVTVFFNFGTPFPELPCFMIFGLYLASLCTAFLFEETAKGMFTPLTWCT